MEAVPEFEDWPELIGKSVLLRQRLHELDPDVNPYTIPHVGASQQDLAATETRLGFRLDSLHQQLLSHANGWDYFFNFTHLFSTEEVGADDRWHRSEELLNIFYTDGPIPTDFPSRHDIYCFCANPAETEDLFVVWKLGPVTDGGRPVSWLTEEEVQRFPNMHEFMMSANEYLHRGLTKLQPH
jgi:hypothetical protein